MQGVPYLQQPRVLPGRVAVGGTDVADGNESALVEVEFEPKLPPSRRRVSKQRQRPGPDVEKSLTEFQGQGLQGSSKQERTKGVALLLLDLICKPPCQHGGQSKPPWCARRTPLRQEFWARQKKVRASAWTRAIRHLPMSRQRAAALHLA